MLFQLDLAQSYFINTELQCTIYNKVLIATFSDHFVTEISLIADTFFIDYLENMCTCAPAFV